MLSSLCEGESVGQEKTDLLFDYGFSVCTSDCFVAPICCRICLERTLFSQQCIHFHIDKMPLFENDFRVRVNRMEGVFLFVRLWSNALGDQM